MTTTAAMALAGAYGTAMAVELEMGPIMEWKTPARGREERRGEGEEDYPKARSKRKRPSRNDSGIILPYKSVLQRISAGQ